MVSWAGMMAQQGKMLASKFGDLGLNLDTHGGRRELSPTGGPLNTMCALLCVSAHTHNNTNS